ncbi:MAG: cyclase family protein [Luteibacter sp.]
MTDKRVCFDFDISFSNGGGIQGQGFRLDIEGSDIDDEALGAYVIRDMGLLMVGEVRILNKTVIDEAHKRGASPGDVVAAADPQGVSIVDLSHTIEDGMITYKGLPAPLICDHLSREASRGIYAEGTEFQIGKIEMVGNTGTYIDVPFHRYAHGHDLAGLAASAVADVPGVVVRVSGAGERGIDWTHFAPVDCRGRAVLVHTGWDRHWRTDPYFEDHPFLTEKAAVYLRDQGVRLVGIDSFNIDDTGGGHRPVHSVLLAEGIPIVEHLTGLGGLPIDGFTFTAAPPKVKGMGTFPVRAFARLPPGR